MLKRDTESRAQGATEYLLILAAVLVIATIAIYYVTRGAGYPPLGATPALEGENTIKIDVSSGSVPAGDWAYSVSATEGTYDWTAVNTKLDTTGYTIGEYAADNYWASLKHIPSGHVYINETKMEIT